VQVQLDQADLALENIQNDAIYFANNGLTKVANDARLGGDFLAETTIDVQGFTFKINSEGDPNRFALLGGTNQLQFGQYGGGVLTGTPVYGLGVEADGKVVELPVSSGPKVYAGLITGTTGTIALTEYENTTGATISISYDGFTGRYSITASSGVFVNAVIFLTTVSVSIVTASVFPGIINLRNYDLAGTLVDFLSNTKVKIEIYP
jgi:hypothetical protein